MIYKTYIYTLSDSKGNIRYVGKSNNITKRVWSHISESKRNFDNYKHRWIRTLLKNGDVPIIEIIDEVSISDWKYWEQYWISQIKTWGYKLTNTTDGGGEGGDTFNALPKEKQQAIRNNSSKLHKNKKRSKETCDNLRIAKTGEKNPMYGKEFSEEHKDNIRKSLNEFYETHNNINKGKKCSEETKDQIKNNNAKYWLGKKCSDITLKKISKPILQFSKNGEFIQEWCSIAEAQRELKIHSISLACNRKLKTVGGFIWKFKDKLYELD